MKFPTKFPTKACLAAAFTLWTLMSAAQASTTNSPARVLWHNSRLLSSAEPPAAYAVEKTFTNIDWKAPIYLIAEPAGDHLWVVLQGGESNRPSRVVRCRNQPENKVTEPVLQMEGRLIYGLTFHPGFVTNRQVFVFSNGPTAEQARTNRISRFSVSARAPFVCDPASEKVVIEWRSAGHDGGDLAFGLDSMLYITSGDGTSDSDTWDTGQSMNDLLAALLRIDVDRPAAGQAYAVPADNPFLTIPSARPEVWAYGFRNPWRMSVDTKTGDIWVGNNGQDRWETAYLVRRGDNFGWSVYEGNHFFYPQRQLGPTPFVPPTIEHDHSEFRSLTGGVVYRGTRHPELNGTYIYGDYATGKIWGARRRGKRLSWHRELVDTSLQITAFREDQRGELLVLDHGGGIYRLVPRARGLRPARFPLLLSETGLFASARDHRVAAGIIPYTINAPAWMDGASAERFLALPGNAQARDNPQRSWDFTNATVLLQTLSLEMLPGTPASRRRLETRLLLKLDGEWAGYSYRWNSQQTDARLVGREGETLSLPRLDPAAPRKARAQTWRIPSRAECMACHSRAANFVLGLSDLQINRLSQPGEEGGGAGPRENQLSRLSQFNLLANPPEKDPGALVHLVNPYDPSQELDQRARSYLHVNCSPCHVSAGGGNAQIQLEFTQAREQMSLIDTRPQHDSFGMANAMLVAAGDPDRSVLLRRVSCRGAGQMPPLWSCQIDHEGTALLRAWIAAMKPALAFVREWTMADLLPALNAGPTNRSVAEGAAIFQKVGCAQCHRFQGQGGTVGPDLTGVGQRLNKVSLLESILDPSKSIADEYAATEIETRHGEEFAGRIERESAREVMLRTAADQTVRIAKGTIVSRRKSTVSNMPAGILNVLEKEQILDLLACLMAAGKTNNAGKQE